MIYVSAATSGPFLTLLKGCLWLLLPWSMRCPWFLAALRLRGCFALSQLKLGRYGLAAAQTRCALSRRCERVGSLRNSSIAQRYARPSSLGQIWLGLLVSYRSLARQGPTTCVRVLPSLLRLPVPVYAALLPLAAALVKLPSQCQLRLLRATRSPARTHRGRARSLASAHNKASESWARAPPSPHT